MPSHLGNVIVGLLVVLLGAGQEPVGSVAGRVTEANAGALPGTTVALTSGALRRTAVADAAGRFTFDGVPAGRYRLVARLPGFLSAADNVIVTPGRVTNVSLTLGSYFPNPDIEPAGTDPADPALARALYDTVFRSVFRGDLPSRLVVQAESIVPRSLIDEDWSGQLAGVPPELRAALAAEGQRRSYWLRRESFPPETRLVPREQMVQFFEKFRLDGWNQLSEQFGTSSYQAVTRVFVTDDGRHALLEYRHHCGSLCGEGALLWLSRATATADSPWSIRGRGFIWVS